MEEALVSELLAPGGQPVCMFAQVGEGRGREGRQFPSQEKALRRGQQGATSNAAERAREGETGENKVGGQHAQPTIIRCTLPPTFLLGT